MVVLVVPRGKIKLDFVLLHRASTIISLKGYTGFKVNKSLLVRKQLAGGISSVRWPIFRTKSSNVAVEKNKCTYSKRVGKNHFSKKVHIWAMWLQIMWQFCTLAYVICVRKPVYPSKFAVLHRLRPDIFAVLLILLYTSLV